MKFTEFRDTTQSTNQQGFAKAQNRIEQGVAEASNRMQKYGQLILKRAKAKREAEATEKAKQDAEQEKTEKEKKQGVAEAKADPLGAWIAHKNGTEARKFKTREGAKKYAASHAGFTVSSSEAFHDTYRNKKDVVEGFPHDVDHMSGKTIKHQDTNCATCHGRKSMYKLGGKLSADNKQGAEKVKCPTCKGTGDKPGVAEGWKDEADDFTEWSNHVKEKLSKASPEQRLGLAKQLSQLEVKHFGSNIPNTFNKQTGKPQAGLGLTDTVRNALKYFNAEQTGIRQYYDQDLPSGTFGDKFGSVTINGMENATPAELALMQKAVRAGVDYARAAGRIYRKTGTITQQDLDKIKQGFEDNAKKFAASVGARMDYSNRPEEPTALAQASLGRRDQAVAESTGPGVDAKGRTQSQWIQLVKAKFPDGKMIQAKMPDGPVQVTLPDGRKLGWKKVEQAVAEGSPHDVDHMPGKTIKHQNTNCTTCHGRKSMYKLGGKLSADNKPGAEKVKCPTCKGTGDKPGVAEGFDKIQEVKKFRTTYGWAGGSKEPRSAHAKQVAAKRKEYDKGLGKFEPTDDMVGTAKIVRDIAMSDASPEHKKAAIDALNKKGVTEDHGPEHPEAPVNYGEYDREGDMAKDDLRTIDDAAEELYSILQADENLPEWVQSKITKAVDYIDTARDYMKAQKYEPGMAEGIFTKGPAIDPIIGKQINSIINRLHYHAKQTKDEYLRGTVQELFAILRNTGGTYSPPGSRDVAEGGAKYKVKSIGHDAKGNYYISPSTGKKVYKKAKVGDHENPKTGEHKGVTEATESRIDDGWFKQGAFKTSKKAAPVRYQLAQQSGTVNTLEGPVRYEAGHYIMTGPKGEQYPISPEKFNTLYDDNGDGTSTPKKISKLAKLADHDGVLHTSWGDLQYTKGNDYIVRHGAGDYGAVKKDIFAQTYDNQSRKSGIDEEKFNITFKAKTPAGKSFEKKYDIDAADKYAAFDKIKKRLGAQYDALNYPTFLQGKKKAKMPPSVKTAMKNLNKGKVS